MGDSINKLTEYFSKFPGIGPRQSRRFVYFLLTRDKQFLDNLARELSELKKEIATCQSCYRFFVPAPGNQKSCDICADQNRDETTLMIVEKDVDYENIERSGSYSGKYFILGGVVPILEEDPQKRIRIKELKKILDERKNDLKEIILALSVNSDGENTSEYLVEQLSPFAKKENITITILGRGLSTGTELEYSDSETIKNALKNRA